MRRKRNADYLYTTLIFDSAPLAVLKSRFLRASVGKKCYEFSTSGAKEVSCTGPRYRGSRSGFDGAGDAVKQVSRLISIYAGL